MDEKTELRVLNVPRNVAHPGLDDRRLRDVVDEARVQFRTAEIRIMDNVGSDQGSFIGCQIRGPATIVAVARQWIVERVPEQVRTE